MYTGTEGAGKYGMSSAAGVYQSLVGFILVMLANYIVRKKDPESTVLGGDGNVKMGEKKDSG